MNKNLFLLLGLVLLIPLVSAECSYSSETNGTDYFVVNIDSVNTTAMGTDQLFVDYTFMTPRLNFTRVVNQTLTVGANGSTSQIGWLFWDNLCNTTMVIKNGTTNITAANYTYVWVNKTGGRAAVQWLTSVFNNSPSVVMSCNRTFTKNVDDLIASDTTINQYYTKEDWLIENSPTNYGDDKTFRLNGSSLGGFANNSNWAVGWSYTERTCDTCSGGDIVMLGVMKIVLFLIGVILILGGLYLFKKGMLSENLLIAYVVGIIIYFAVLPFLHRTLAVLASCA